MSRILYVAALGAVGLFTFASSASAAPAAVPAPSNSTTQKTTVTTTAENTAPANQAATMRPWRASQTIGLRVDDPQGDKLGKIEDIVFNPADGHIRYAVLSFGGVIGIGEKYFAIPWKHLRAETKTGTTGNESFVMVLDVNKNKLKNAPGFDSKSWPEFGNSAYGTSVDEFFGENSTAAHPRATNTK